MTNFKCFDEVQRIRRISVDTNVLSKVMYYIILYDKGKLYKKKGISFEELADSLETIIMILSTNIRPVGINIVRKELKKRKDYALLYDSVFKEEVKPNKEIKQLAKFYTNKINIGSADSLIVASASMGKIDVFLSWNRDDIIKKTAIEKIQSINKKRRVHFPILMTPKDFLDHLFFAENRIICLSPIPTPRRFHPRFSFPK